MALMQTPLCNFGWKAPDFRLEGTDGQYWTLSEAKGPKGLLVMFICNHCPYVKAIVSRLVAVAKELQNAGIGVIAVMPNDPAYREEDSFENMKKFADVNDFSFPYVIDEAQTVARAYDAVCTPDFFGFNAELALQYRGRLDEVNPSNPEKPNTQQELLEAMLMVAQTGKGPEKQTPSMGCSIKWKAAA